MQHISCSCGFLSVSIGFVWTVYSLDALQLSMYSRLVEHKGNFGEVEAHNSFAIYYSLCWQLLDTILWPIYDGL